MTPEHLATLKAAAQARFAAIMAAKAPRGEAPIKATSAPPIARVLAPASPASAGVTALAAPAPSPAVSNLSTGVTLNADQQRGVDLIASGVSCCFIGAAGTGKTTAVNAALLALLASHKVPMLAENTKLLLKGTPGVVGIAFTRRASANLRKQMPAQLASNVMTLHALLEFEPVEYIVTDAEGKERNSMRFEPKRTARKPLPDTLHTIVIDESSMLSVELFKLLLNALSHPVQFVFIGDIQQLAPVFGEAILGFKLLELPTVELTVVYRQALESPIIRLAHAVLAGKQIAPPELTAKWQHKGQLTIARWPAAASPEKAENIACAYLTERLRAGTYDPSSDMVLIPFNKHFGTLRMGKRIAGILDEVAASKGTPRTLVEIIAGFNRHYLAVGDRMLYENDEVIIKKIYPNPRYTGKLQPRIAEFSRFGTLLGAEALAPEEDWLTLSVAALDDTQPADTVDEASHCILLDYGDGDAPTAIKTRGTINKLAFAYCTTVHKAQGLQAPRVFLLAHKQHNIMICRELLYTAITRAQHELVILCDNATFMGGIVKQQIKGTTLAEKAIYFQGKSAKYQATIESEPT